ncbi:MAG: serine hydrolase domain-containing protein [Thermodesulfobacteriota bacterium]
MKQTDVVVHGFCDAAFESVKQAFIDNFRRKKETGAALALTVAGKTVVDIWGGFTDFSKQRPWREDTLANIYSATKGITALCALRLADEGRLDLDAPVTRYWPDFGRAGKDAITVRMLLNHTAGMVAVRSRLPGKALYDWDTMTSVLAAHSPWWPPGQTLGYHALTYGWLVGHVIRRITGLTVGQYLKQEVTGPLGLDLHIGLDPSEHRRSATMIMLRFPTLHADAARLAGAIVKNPRGPTACAFSNPWTIVTGVNTRSWRSAEIPAANGQSTARALARVYGVLACGGKNGSREILSPAMIDRCSQEESAGRDAVLQLPTRFSLGFMMNQDNPSGNFGPGRKSFGHPGAGGCLGFADPERQLGFGYVVNKMDTFILIDPRAKSIINATYQCL